MKLTFRKLPLAALLTLISFSPAFAAPQLAVIIDDLGYGTWPVDRAINLPAAITLSVFPSLPSSASVAEKAHAAGHEILVHLPMQPKGADNKLNPGTLLSNMSETQFLQQLMLHLQSVPYAIGASNHMGSQLTAERRPMLLTMSTLKSWGNLFFVDSRTTKDTVAQTVAGENQLANTRRDVFIDNDQSLAAIRSALTQAIAKAKLNGQAVAIGHPHLNTLTVLENELVGMVAAAGVELVPISVIIDAQNRAIGIANTPPAQPAATATRRPGTATPTPGVSAKSTISKAPAGTPVARTTSRFQVSPDMPIQPAASIKPTEPTRTTAATNSAAAPTTGKVVYANRAEGVIYADSAANRAFLDDIPLAKSYPAQSLAPGE